MHNLDNIINELNILNNKLKLDQPKGNFVLLCEQPGSGISVFGPFDSKLDAEVYAHTFLKWMGCEEYPVFENDTLCVTDPETTELTILELVKSELPPRKKI